MCGILYMEDFAGKPVNTQLIERFKAQRNRGVQGFGVYTRKTDELVHNTDEDGILAWLKKNKRSDILFHHRFPTSAPNVEQACHPFSTGDFFETNYTLVHNGWLTDSDDRTNYHLGLGINYQSLLEDGQYNDSETLTWEFALYMEDKIPKIEVHGSVAFICMARSAEGDKLMFYRNSGNPLLMSLENDAITLASEGEGEQVPEDALFIYDLQTRQLTFKAMEVSRWSPTPVGSNYQYSGLGQVNRTDNTPENKTVPMLSAKDLEPEEDDEMAKRMQAVGDFCYPLSKSVVESYWPGGHDFRLAKGVRNLYNRELEEAYGNYDDAYLNIEKKIKLIGNVVQRSKKTKTIAKWTNKLKVAEATLDIMLSSPYWDATEAIDPYFETVEVESDFRKELDKDKAKVGFRKEQVAHQ